MDTVRFTYVGPPAQASALAHQLEMDGVSVDYHPPVEKKDLATALALVSVLFAATGPVSDIVAGVQRFLTRFPDARVDGLPDEHGALSVSERLARIDDLKASGSITDEEHADLRSRVLGEL